MTYTVAAIWSITASVYAARYLLVSAQAEVREKNPTIVNVARCITATFIIAVAPAFALMDIYLIFASLAGKIRGFRA